MKNFLVLVAGGNGIRMGREIPKQFLIIGRKPVLSYSLHAFLEFDPGIETILVLPEEWISYWEKLTDSYNLKRFDHVVTGGRERFHSVSNGLKLVNEEGLVAVHDSVRPLVSNDTIRKCFTSAKENGNAIPVVSPSESVRVDDGKGLSRSFDRGSVMLVQTPQVFRSGLLKKAYERKYHPEFTDDASVLEAAGEKIFTVEGNRENIKITTPGDLLFAETILLK